MPTATDTIIVMKSDGSSSNQSPPTIGSLPERTTTARDASIDDDDSEEEVGAWIWKSSRTAITIADAKTAAAMTTTGRECEPSAN